MNKKQLKFLDEVGVSGKYYGPEAPVISGKVGKRCVTLNAYTLIHAIITKKNKDFIEIPLNMNKNLLLDLVTREALFVNTKTGEEAYLDKLVFSEE